MTSLEQKPGHFRKRRGPFRKNALALAGFGVAAFSVSFFFFLDPLLESVLESYLSAVNGAQVSIGHLKSHLFNGTLKITELQVADSSMSRRNLFSIDFMQLKFDPSRLLRKKFVISKMQIEGIRLLTPRETSGELPPGAGPPEGIPGILERVASGFYANVKQELSGNPLRNLGQLALGLDLKHKIANVSAHLRLWREVHELTEDLHTKAEGWEKAQRELATRDFTERVTAVPMQPNPSGEPSTLGVGFSRDLQELEKSVEQQESNIETEARLLENRRTKLTENIDDDVLQVRRELGLAHDSGDDLTPQLFGPKVLEHLERITYWVDLGRRRMPAGSPTLVTQASQSGTRVQFGKPTAAPAFLLLEGSVTSSTTADPNHAKVSGEFGGVTSHPSLFGYPFVLKMDASLPNRGLESLHIQARVDHTQEGKSDKPLEHITIDAKRFPVRNWLVNDFADLKWGVESANARIGFEIAFEESDVKARWNIFFSDVEYTVTSPYPQVENTLKRLLNPIHQFELVGSLEGPAEGLKLRLESDIGRKLAVGLREEFRVPLLALDDSIRSNLINMIGSPQRELGARIQYAQKLALGKLEAYHERIRYWRTKRERAPSRDTASLHQ